jgi:putative phosphoesterase
LVLRVGLVADTHGLLRDQVLEALAGVDHVVHAGDIGDPSVLQALARIAPVTAVWGNVDGPALRAALPELARVELGGVRVTVAHHVEAAVSTAAVDRGRRLVVFGHSHRPSVARRDGMLLVNPGSAGRRRFRLPVTVALATVERRRLDAEIVEFDV